MGKNGNVNVLSGYKYASPIAINQSFYQYNPSIGDGKLSYGSKPTGLANPDLTWETSEQVDLGLDARFLNDRLSFSLDWYRKNTKDLLVEINPLPEIGVSKYTVNSGKVLNTGFDFELGWKDRINDFKYSVSFNGSTLKNEVKDLYFIYQPYRRCRYRWIQQPFEANLRGRSLHLVLPWL